MKCLFIGSFLSASRGTKGVAESLAEQLVDEGIHLQLVSKYENKLLRIIDILFSILIYKGKKVHIDVFSGTAFHIADLASRMARFNNKQVIFTLHGGKLIEFASVRLPKIKAVFRRAHYIQTPSLFLQTFFKDQGFNVQYLPNGLEINNFQFERQHVKPFSLLWVRAFTSIYNPQVAIYILTRMIEKYPECTLTMIGPDKGELRSCEVLAKQLGVLNSITFTGGLPNISLKNYYQKHAVFLNTTSYESFGVAVVEAALCGIPIVSNSVGEIPYLWSPQKNIMLVKENSIDEYEAHIRHLFDDGASAMQLAVNARRFAETFSWENIKLQWIKILQS